MRTKAIAAAHKHACGPSSRTEENSNSPIIKVTMSQRVEK